MNNPFTPAQPKKRGPKSRLSDESFCAALIAAVESDATAKAVAIELSLTHSKAIRYAWLLGYRRMYVTAAERAEVMRARKLRAQSQANKERAA